MSLRFKTIFSVALVIFIFGISAVLFVYSFSINSIVNTKKSDLVELGSSFRAEFEQVLNQAVLVSNQISKDKDIINFYEDPDLENIEDVISLLDKYNVGDAYASIYLMDKNGLALASTDLSFIGKNYFFRDYFKDALNSSSDGNSFQTAIGVTSGELGYYFGKKITNEEGLVLGVVALKLNPDYLEDTLFFIKKIKHNLYLSDTNGFVLYSNDPGSAFSFLGEVSKKDFGEYLKMQKYGNLEDKSLGYDFLVQKFVAVEDNETYEFYNYLDNTERYAVIYNLQSFPLYLILEQDKYSLYKQPIKAAYYLSLFVFLAAFFSVIFIYLFLTKYLKPFGKINKIIDEISKGNYDVEINIRDVKDKEFKDLLEVLFKMSKNIKNNNKNTEAKIKKRTEELYELNKYMTGRELKMIELKKIIKNLKNNK